MGNKHPIYKKGVKEIVKSIGATYHTSVRFDHLTELLQQGIDIFDCKIHRIDILFGSGWSGRQGLVNGI